MPFDGDVRKWSYPERQQEWPDQQHHYTAVVMALGMASWGMVTLVMAVLTLHYSDPELAYWFFGASVVMFGAAIWLVERQLRGLLRAMGRFD